MRQGIVFNYFKAKMLEKVGDIGQGKNFRRAQLAGVPESSFHQHSANLPALFLLRHGERTYLNKFTPGYMDGDTTEDFVCLVHRDLKFPQPLCDIAYGQRDHYTLIAEFARDVGDGLDVCNARSPDLYSHKFPSIRENAREPCASCTFSL